MAEPTPKQAWDAIYNLCRARVQGTGAEWDDINVAFKIVAGAIEAREAVPVSTPENVVPIKADAECQSPS